jgi:hypothetical protein
MNNLKHHFLKFIRITKNYQAHHHKELVIHSRFGTILEYVLSTSLFKVTVPAYPSPFQPNKLCRTVEDAKCFAAEFVMSQMGIPMDG